MFRFLVSFKNEENRWKSHDLRLFYVQIPTIRNHVGTSLWENWFSPKFGRKFSKSPSSMSTNTYLTLQIDFSIQSDCMDKPSWGVTNWETIERNLPLIWPLTVFWIFKNLNFKNSWIWWSRQGVDEFSRFEACKRSGMMRRCAQMSWTWSGLI